MSGSFRRQTSSPPGPQVEHVRERRAPGGAGRVEVALERLGRGPVVAVEHLAEPVAHRGDDLLAEVLRLRPRSAPPGRPGGPRSDGRGLLAASGREQEGGRQEEDRGRSASRHHAVAGAGRTLGSMSVETSRSREAYFESSADRPGGVYLADPDDPYRQSGRSSGAARWEETRRPSRAIDRDGDVLDVGCANGLLLETLIGWCAERRDHDPSARRRLHRRARGAGAAPRSRSTRRRSTSRTRGTGAAAALRRRADEPGARAPRRLRTRSYAGSSRGSCRAGA